MLRDFDPAYKILMVIHTYSKVDSGDAIRPTVCYFHKVKAQIEVRVFKHASNLHPAIVLTKIAPDSFAFWPPIEAWPPLPRYFWGMPYVPVDGLAPALPAVELCLQVLIKVEGEIQYVHISDLHGKGRRYRH